MKNFLIVTNHAQIGDLICSIPMYKAIKYTHSDSKITLAAPVTNYEIPFKELNKYIDDVIIFDKSSFKAYIDFFGALLRKSYYAGIVPSNIVISTTTHVINFLSAAGKKTGVNSIDGKKNKSSFLLNIKKDFNWENIHQSERCLDVVEQIDCRLPSNEKKADELELTDENFRFADRFINESFVSPGKKLIGIHPGAGKEENIWSIENFYKIIIRLNEIYNPNFYITSGGEESTSYIIKKLRDAGINAGSLHNAKVKDLAAVYKKTSLYITNDTGVMHLAGLMNTPLLALFGPTNPLVWGPIGDKSFFIKAETSNINDISILDVHNVACKIMDLK